jgi:hypothetical protein
MFAQIAQPVHVPALEEIEKQFMTEFDYVKEGEQLNQVKHNLQKAGLEGPGKLCRVPKAYMEYCTSKWISSVCVLPFSGNSVIAPSVFCLDVRF